MYDSKGTVNITQVEQIYDGKFGLLVGIAYICILIGQGLMSDVVFSICGGHASR